MNPFKDYFNKGLVKQQKPNFEQIAKQLRRALQDLKTAQHTLDFDPEWASTIAYQAMLRAGRASLFANGYLPVDGAQHKTVVELTGKLLGAEYGDLVRQFEKLRKKRNSFFYDSEDTGNKGEAEKALEVAKVLLTKIKTYIEGLNPQFRFDF